ncbi:hypothetical protein EBR66_00850 [bacterium]|nr:hypothetical protein [bacterium]
MVSNDTRVGRLPSHITSTIYGKKESSKEEGKERQERQEITHLYISETIPISGIVSFKEEFSRVYLCL